MARRTKKQQHEAEANKAASDQGKIVPSTTEPPAKRTLRFAARYSDKSFALIADLAACTFLEASNAVAALAKSHHSTVRLFTFDSRVAGSFEQMMAKVKASEKGSAK